MAAVVAASLLFTGCTADASPDTAATTSSTPAPGTVSIADLLQLGIASAQAGDVKQAEATFKNVLALDPANALANYNLGVLAQQAGDADAAIGFYDAAIATDSKFTSAMYNKAILLEATDRDAAIKLYRSIVEIDDQAATAYFRLSLLLKDAGDTAGAEDARQKALAIDPSLDNAGTGK